MSDALTDIKRDEDIYAVLYKIVIAEQDGVDIEPLLQELETMPRGYWCPEGRIIAARIRASRKEE